MLWQNSGVKMELNEYQNAAMGFRLPSANAEYALFNLGAEAGEVLGVVAKGIRDTRSFDYEQKIKKELGDVLWHVAAVALDNGFTLEEVAMANIAKLSKRKEEGVIQGSGDDR